MSLGLPTQLTGLVQEEAMDLIQSAPLESLPPINNLITIAVISAVSAYGVTWFVRGILGVRGGKWGWKLRLTALLSGAATGFSLGGYPWGLILGVCGGGLVTAVIAVIKKRIKDAAG